jgi:hypothetical protein
MAQDFQGNWFITDIRDLIIDGIWPTYVPPNTSSNAAWWAGGSAPSGLINVIQRTTFATDTVNASNRSALTAPTRILAGASNDSFAWWAGGQIPGSPSLTNVIQRTTFATDTVNASNRSALISPANDLAGASNDSFAWWAGGVNPGSPGNSNVIQRTTFATDTVNASNRSALTAPISSLAGASNNSFAWWAGGITTAPGRTNVIQRTTFANDTQNASNRSALIAPTSQLAGASNDSFAWWAGGFTTAPGLTNVIQRTTFATDTVNASNRSALIAPTNQLAGASNDSFAWWAGGTTPGSPGLTNVIQRTTFATDTVNASNRSDLIAPTNRLAGASN